MSGSGPTVPMRSACHIQGAGPREATSWAVISTTQTNAVTDSGKRALLFTTDCIHLAQSYPGMETSKVVIEDS